MGWNGGTGLVPSNRNFADGVALCFGSARDACFVYDVTDANANVLMLDFEKSTVNDVPVFVIGDDIIGVDLGFFNGIIEPALAVVDDDNDSAIRLGFTADDRPALLFHGSAGALEIIRAGTPLIVQNSLVQADDQVLILRGPDQSGAEAVGDELFMSFEMDTADGFTEVVRLTAELLDVGAGTTDARFSIDVMTADALVTMFQIDSSAAGVITTTIPTGDLVLNDNVSIRFGTAGAESDLQSNGSNTIWNLTSGNLQLTGGVTGGDITAVLTILNSRNSADVTLLSLQGQRGTGAAGDAARILLRMDNASSAIVTIARMGQILTTPTAGSEVGAVTFDTLDGSGTLNEVIRFAGNGNVSLGIGEGGTVAATGNTFRAPDLVTGGAGNVAGADLTLAAGIGTGTGDEGTILFALPIVAAAGDNIQTRATRLTLDMVGSTSVLTMASAQAMDITTAAGDLRVNPSGIIIFQSSARVNDDLDYMLGDGNDIRMRLRSTVLAADTEITNVIVGTSDHQGVAANSFILSNRATDGDMMFLVSDGGNSLEFLNVTGATANLDLGHGMATITLLTASGTLTLSPVGGLVITSNARINNAQIFGFGTSSNVAFVFRGSSLAADTTLSSVIEGTPDHQGYAADTMIISNISNDGDMMFLVSDAGDSKEFLNVTGATANLDLGHGMATVEIKTASGDLTLNPGGNVIFPSGVISIFRGSARLDNNVNLALGSDDDVILRLDGSGEAADAEITGVIVGTSNHQGFAANSLVQSNITTDGDIIMLVSDGGNSLEFLLADADVAHLHLGFAMINTTVYASGDITLNSGGNVVLANDSLIQRDVNSGLTASVTQTQGNGALTADVNEVATVANTNDTVTLPSAIGGLKITIINNGANTLQIFPASGDDLGSGGDTATTLASGSNVVFQAYDATNWEIV